MKLKKVEIQAFRAYNEKSKGTFDFTIKDDNDVEIAANFISIYAPNGFGKSSFYDAVEWALTSRVDRYEDTIFESAARETKVKKIALHVIRNHDAQENLATSVGVYTTTGEFYNELGVTRTNAIDLNVKKKKLEDGIEKYREIFLSQDAIDHFIRGVTPEIRYKDFMTFYGGKTEVLRNDLQLLYADTNTLLEELSVKESKLNEEISAPLNGAVVDSFYETVAQVRKFNVELKSIPESIVEMDVDELSEELARNKIKVNSSFEGLEHEIEIINSLSDKSEEYLSRCAEIESAIAYQSNVNKSLADLRMLATLNNEFANCSEQKNEMLSTISRHGKLAESISSFRSLFFERDIAKKAILNLESALKGFDAEANAHQVQRGMLSETILQLRKNMQTWQVLSDGAVNVYNRVANLRGELKLIRESEPEKIAQLNSVQNDIQACDSGILKLKNLNLNSDLITPEDLAFIEVNPEILSSFREISTAISEVRSRITHLNMVSKSLESQSNLFEKLISLGREVLANHPSDNCPLCQHQFSSLVELNSAIEDNSNLRKVFQEVIAELDERNRKLEELNFQKEANIKYLAQKKEAKLQALESISSQRNLEVTRLKELMSRDSSRIASINSEIINQQAVVLNLSEGDLRLRISVELSGFEEKIRNAQSKFDEVVLKLEFLENKKQQSVTETHSIHAKIAAVEANLIYRDVAKYLEEHNQPIEDYATLFPKLTAQHAASLAKIEEQINSLSEKMLDVNERLQESGLPTSYESLSGELIRIENVISETREKIAAFTRQCSLTIGEAPEDSLELTEALGDALDSAESKRHETKVLIEGLELLNSLAELLSPFIRKELARSEVASLLLEKEALNSLKVRLDAEINNVNKVLVEQLNSVFYTDLINTIYRKIDPHPSFKEVKFVFGFSVKDKPCLNVLVSECDSDGAKERIISPLLYFSAAQLNILSLSIFLARALHARDKDGNPLDVILIDDPIHSMDSINILSTIDLFRGISVNLDKQIIISTHDENFYELLKRKLPREYCPSKFLKLKNFGEVSVDT